MQRKLAAAAAAFMSLCVVLTGSFCSTYAVRAETAGTEEASEASEDSGYRFELKKSGAAVKACGDLSWVQFQEPEGRVPMAEEGTGISFETTDLDGNAVNAADIFGAHKITMVNIWGTFCGPCINEMPDLEELNGRLGEKDCAIIGVVCDVAGKDYSAMIGTAKEIIADTGVTYLNLVPWESFAGDLPSQFVPTTYFIDSNGQVVGDAAIGARGADEYEALLDEVLGE